MRSFLITLSLLSLLSFPSKAYDENGFFVIGGGVGGFSCEIFVSQMEASRLRGGLDSIAGLDAVLGFISYILGFQTGYNAAHLEIADIFSAVDGTTDTEAILHWTEKWCRNHPKETFGKSVVEYASKKGAHIGTVMRRPCLLEIPAE